MQERSKSLWNDDLETPVDTSDINYINHFHEIGWMDPYHPTTSFAGHGDQNNIIRKTFEDPVYDSRFYLSADFPPPLIFLPSDHLLESMIRKVSDCQEATIEELLS